MFQPLLDAFIESVSIKKELPLISPPLKIAVANWWPLKNSEKKGFRDFILHVILKQRYKIILHSNPNEPSDLVFGNPLEQARKILSY
ncbi:fucosyltransferase, partial [Helicobacter pylori H13-1]|nr:fucosyltransferase [Helicobacter pylori H13-1]